MSAQSKIERLNAFVKKDLPDALMHGESSVDVVIRVIRELRQELERLNAAIDACGMRSSVDFVLKGDMLSTDRYFHGKPEDWNDNIQGT